MCRIYLVYSIKLHLVVYTTCAMTTLTCRQNLPIFPFLWIFRPLFWLHLGESLGGSLNIKLHANLF